MKLRQRRRERRTVWVVHHATLDAAIAVFSTYKKAWKAYPQDSVKITSYEIDPRRIFDLDVP